MVCLGRFGVAWSFCLWPWWWGGHATTQAVVWEAPPLFEWEQLAWALCPQWCPDNARSTTMITPVGCDVIVSQQPGDITTQGWHWFEPSKLRHSREFTNGCSRASLQTYSVRTLGVFKSISIQLTRQLFGSPAGTGVAYLPEVQ